MATQIEAASRALYAAAAPLMPAMSGCPNCGTAHMIASPAPLGSCSDCGADVEVLPASGVAARSRLDLASVA